MGIADIGSRQVCILQLLHAPSTGRYRGYVFTSNDEANVSEN